MTECFSLQSVVRLMPETVDIRCADDPRDIVHRSCQLLAEGQLLLVPTETQYTLVANGLHVAAVDRLAALSDEFGLELAVRSADDGRDYWSNVPRTAIKLARRCWPGPVVLALKDVGGLYEQLPESIRRHLVRPAGVHFRSSAHPLCSDLQRYLPGPLVSIADGHSTSFPRKTPADVPTRWTDAAALILNDGPCRYGEATTVVQIDGSRWTVLSEGVVGSRHVARLAGEVYLFVCTGNTCRSPMAEAIFRKLLAERLKCQPHELEDHGYVVLSAGLAATIGAPASREAVELLAHSGIDLSEHGSQPVTDRLLQQADAIYTMTRQHRQAILASHPELESRVRTLAEDRTDIPDPIGGSREVYEDCQRAIDRHVRAIVDQIAPE